MIEHRTDTVNAPSPGVSAHERDQAWELARLWSPRRTARVADKVVDGIIENTYSSTAPLDGPAPAGTWAMYLTDVHGYYCWVAFDFDAKAGNPVSDTKRLAGWLKQLGIPYLVCRSGPGGGRHVWIRANHLHGATVAGIAHRAKSLLPSLDLSPLTNVRYGAVRPPLSPHRVSGSSWPIGDPYILDNHDGIDEDDARALLDLLDSLGATITVPDTAGIRGMVSDGRGRPRLSGQKRMPSPRILTLLRDGDPYQPDKSVLQATVLAGLARARWSFDDILSYLPHSPALEHARTVPVRERRVPRGPRRTMKALENHWRLAVRYVAANKLPHSRDEDPDSGFTARADAVAQAVHMAQEHANAQPGRWGASSAAPGSRQLRGRPSHRAVLDAICLYMLQGVSLDVEADTRRLAIDTGYSREACRQALVALAEDGTWLVKTEDAEGAHAARFALSQKFSTESSDPKWSQPVTPPAGAAAPAFPPRHTQIVTLGARLELLAHDVFAAPRSLGRTAGRVLRELPQDGMTTVKELHLRHRFTGRALSRALRRLARFGLATRVKTGWACGSDTRDHAAQSLGVAGYLEARKATYGVERVVWAWWCAEFDWMNRKRSGHGRYDPAQVPLTDSPVFPRYPKNTFGKRDHVLARRFVEAGALDRQDEIQKIQPFERSKKKADVRFVA